MASKKPSGAEYRKRKKNREECHQNYALQLHDWLQKPGPSIEATEIKKENATTVQDDSRQDQKEEMMGTTTEIIEACREDSNDEEELSVSKSDLEQQVFNNSINVNDPPSWPPISDKIRLFLTQHGPEQGHDADFRETTAEGGRRFSKEWFYKKCSNGERVHRNWLIYSKTSRSIFCFSCIVFGKGKIDSSICNKKKGFKDWKNLNRINDHENCASHRDAYLQWKCFEKNIKCGGLIDDSLQKAILTEKEKWRNILRVVLDVILFCAKNNLPLRGTKEHVGSSNAGMFLNLIELISHYNTNIAEHIANHKKKTVSYLSHIIQDEFISLLGDHVRNKILSRIKEAKYFSLLFDCTPDASHQEQMCEVIRYVLITNESITIEESFIDFIATKEKTGSGLAEDIVNKLEKDGLDIKNVRGQGYDNGANMAGIYNGVQAKICQRNDQATYIPCAAHNLNLVCKNAASVNTNMITFFGIVQRIYTFFVKSTSRWEKLQSVLNITLKGHTDTRWASRANAVNALHQQLPLVYQVLQSMKDEKSSQCAEVESILKQINFKFLYLLTAWNLILQEVDKINKALQSKTITIHKAARLLESLSNAMQQMRDNMWEVTYSTSENLASQMKLSTQFENKRKKKSKLDYCLEQSTDDPQKHFFTVEIKEVIDTLNSQLKWRYEKLYEVSLDFECLTGEKLQSMDLNNLKKSVCDLALKYPGDLNPVEFSSEISSFKYHASILIPNLKEASCLDILKTIHNYGLVQSYPNLEVALRIFLTLPVTVASGERSFSKLKLIKTYLRSSLAQEKLSNMAILSIEKFLVNQINFEKVIDDFASLKARKIKL